MIQRLINNLKLFFKNKTKVRVMSNFVIAILCIFAFALTSFYVMGSILTTKFNENNQLIVNTASKSLNEVFKKIDDVYKTLENLNETRNIFGETGVISSESNVKINVASEITKNILSYDFIDEIIFLKKDQSNIMSSQGVMNKEEFFDKKYNSELYGVTFFNNIITDYLNVKMIPATSYKNLVKYPTEDPKRLFVFIKTVSDSNMNIILFISEDRFLKVTNLDSINSKVRLKIYDYNDSIVFSNTSNNFMINTNNIPKDFSEEIIDHSFKKYYIIKSSYNYFYYVAEIDNYILKAFIYSFLLLLLGFLISIYILLKKATKLYQELSPVYEKLQIDQEDGYIDEINLHLDQLNLELDEQKGKIGSMTEEIKNSIFLKIIHSSSYYSKNKGAVDLVFDSIINYNLFIILSVETLKENNKYLRYEVDAISDCLNKNKIKFVQIEERTKKNLFVLGISEDLEFHPIIELLQLSLLDMREKDIETLVSYSKEFNDLSSLYDAYGDIKICRDYRGINDKLSVLNAKNIVFGSNLFMPINFKDELTGKIMAKDENGIKEYIKNIFNVNIKNNVPVIKFEYLLRIMQNTITEALSMVKKDSSDVFELEQVFVKRIENLKDDFDVEGIINSFINLLHLSISLYDTKKSTLNRSDIIKYINSRYHEDLYLEKIATKFGTTSKYFSNYFKKEFLIGFNEYLTQVRISHAKKILTETELSLAEVGEKVGYSNQATFAVAFKKNVAMPPGKYREMNKARK